MPRIFWSQKRKAQLMKDSETLTIKEMAKKYFQQPAEIERMLMHLRPGKKPIVRTYMDGKHKVTVYRPAFAAGAYSQHIGASHVFF